MTLTIKHESPRHALISEDGHWLATVNTEKDRELAEAVAKLIEERRASGANRGETTLNNGATSKVDGGTIHG